MAGLGVPRLRGPDERQLGLARLGGTVGLLARASGRLALADRHAGPVDAEVHGGGGGRLIREGLAGAFGGGNLASKRLGGAFDVLGLHPHGGQVRKQLAGFGETDQRGVRPVMRSTPGESELRSSPRLRSRGKKPWPQAEQW